MTQNTKLAASILTADFVALGAEIQVAVQAGIDWLHIDVMDGHFVPNLTIGPLVTASLRRMTRLPLDVHLMVMHPERLIPAFAEAGADHLIVHIEACTHLFRVVQQIKDLGMRPGVALNPATPLSALEEILPEIDLVLLMSVNPGFGGQSFLPGSLVKAARLQQWLGGQALAHGVEVEMDGGIKPQNAAMVAAAGVHVLVAGSAIFDAECQRPDGMDMREWQQSAIWRNREERIRANVAAFRAAL